MKGARLGLALATIVAWIATALLTRGGSIHIPLAIVSVGLLIAAFVIDGPHLKSLLVIRPLDVIVGIGGGFVMALLTRVAYEAATVLTPSLVTQVAVLYGTAREAPPRALTLPLLAVIIACEEVVWRGVLTRDRKTSVQASLGYTVAQIGAASWLLAPIALVCGLIWGEERLARRGLVAPYLTHLVWNLLVLIYLPLDAPVLP